MPKAKPIPAPVDDFANYPAIAILERRLEHPEDPGSAPIYLKGETHPSCDDIRHFWKANGKAHCPTCTKTLNVSVPFRRWKIRTINAAIPNRLHSVTFNKGYEKVMRDELQDADQISDLAPTTDQTVRRGEKGQLVVVKMPFPYYAKIKLKELENRQARDQSAKAVKEDLADAAGAELGDEAGSTVHGKRFVADFDRPRSTVQDELTRPID